MISAQVQPQGQAGGQFGLQTAPAPGSITCPGLYYPTVAPDGALLRLRFPGGLLNARQCRSLASFSESLGAAAVDVTNRANVQIRGLVGALPHRLVASSAQLALDQLAAPLVGVDHLRNIMASPTAGIDPAQRLDTRPLVRALDAYISAEPRLVGLSPKFSVGCDGGERVSMAQQPNDLLFRAIEVDQQVYLQLDLSEMALDCYLMPPSACVEAVAAIAECYLDCIDPALVRKPRLRQVLQAQRPLLQRLRPYRAAPVAPADSPAVAPAVAPAYGHLGIHPQRQSGRFYIGVALPLGRLTLEQLRQLANLSETYGSGSVRLTPWRNLLLSDIAEADLPAVQRQLADLGLSDDPVWGGLVACSGLTGCLSAATDTQADAAALAAALTQLGQLEPLTIHFSGCPKSCAHRTSSDLTLVGDPEQHSPRYSLYADSLDAGAGETFGRLIAADLAPAELPEKITSLLTAYRQYRPVDLSTDKSRDKSTGQSFRDFVSQQPLAQLQAWISGGRC